jgi:hypothetical protein
MKPPTSQFVMFSHLQILYVFKLPPNCVLVGGCVISGHLNIDQLLQWVEMDSHVRTI